MNAETGSFVEDLRAAFGAQPLNATAKEECEARGRDLVDLYKAGKTQSFPTIFEVVEQYFIFGSEEDQKLVIVGFLESIKNYCVMIDLDYAVFEEWIGPETFQGWRWLEKRWQGRRSLASVADGVEDKPLRLSKKSEEN